MSSILKALRKIEENKRVAEYAAPDLAHDQGAVPAKSSALRPLFAGIAIGAVVVGLIFLQPKYTVDLATRQSTVKPLAIAATETMEQTPSLSIREEGTVVSQPSTNLPSKILPVAPEYNSIKAVDARQVPVAVLPQEKIVVSVARRAETVLAKDVTSSSNSSRKSKIALKPDITRTEKSAPKVKSLPPVAPVVDKPTLSLQLPAGVDLQLTEIFYQEDSASSMAVVNDLPVMVGSQVDSAVVTAIRPDSVMVKIDDNVYNLTLTRP